MSGLSALKFVTSKPQQGGGNPQQARRQKLSIKLSEQIQLAEAQQAGTDFSPTKVRTVRDEVTGESRKVQTPKRLKPWWWRSENGKLCITVRYGARSLEIVPGKNAIETDDLAEVITTLRLLRTAADQGELDQRIQAISGSARAVKAAQDSGAPTSDAPAQKRSILKLPSKAA